jgi:Na+/phosphate symporter
MERVVGTLVRPFFKDQEQTDIENSELDLKTGLNQRLDKITFLNEKITDYLLITSRGDLNSDQSKEVFSLVSTVNYLESMNNIIKL